MVFIAIFSVFEKWPSMKKRPKMGVFRGASDRNRTGDLVLTKDALVPTELQKRFNFSGLIFAPHFAPHGDELR